MGFLDSVLGGGGKVMDISGSKKLIDDSRYKQRDIYQQLSGLVAPYASLGKESANKLSGLLGIDTPNISSLYQGPEQLAKAAYHYYSSSDPDSQNRQLYMNSATGEVGFYGDTPLFSTQSGGKHNQAELEAKSREAYDRLNVPPERGEDYGSLLEDFTMDDYEESPNYQFNLAEGEKALNRASAARGNYNSPAAVKDLLGYSQNLASNEFLNSYNMFNQDKDSIYNKLMGTVGTGQNAVSQQIPVSESYSQGYTDLNSNLSQLQLAQQADKAAKRQSSFGNLANIAQLGIKAYAASDRRLKENIDPAGERNGFNLYKFNYKDLPDQKFIGVMAQEVQESRPDAVHEIDGYLAVDYDALGLKMEAL